LDAGFLFIIYDNSLQGLYHSLIMDLRASLQYTQIPGNEYVCFIGKGGNELWWGSTHQYQIRYYENETGEI
jgi:hypothetical protein